MADYRLAKPPLIDTTIATSENYYTHQISGLPQRTGPSVLTYAGETGTYINGAFSGQPVVPAPDPITWSNLSAKTGNDVATLRSMNPSMSAGNPGDAITSGIFEFQALSGSDANGQIDFAIMHFSSPFRYQIIIPAQPAPPVNFNHRYAIDAVGINAMALTPAGHGKAGDAGMWASLYTMDASSGGFPTVRLAFHPQSRSIQDYATQWSVESAPLTGIAPDAQAGNTHVNADMASQRLGNYVYAFGGRTKLAATTFDSQGSVTRYDQYQAIVVKRIGPGRDVQTRIDFDCSTVGENGDLRSELPHPAFAANAQHQFFVSDDASPFIWTTFGDVSTLYNAPIYGFNIETVGWFGFVDDGSSNFGTLKQSQSTGNYTATGQLGAYLQVVALPSGVYAFGPTLVFPWRAGNYGPPELWYFVMHGVRKQATFDIYAAKWARNQYQRIPNLVLGDDPNFQSSARRFPTGNPDGYAFDQNWYRPANKLASIGPFPNCDVWNQKEDPFGISEDLIRYPGFRVMRDCNRIGQMQFVMASNGPRTGLVSD